MHQRFQGYRHRFNKANSLVSENKLNRAINFYDETIIRLNTDYTEAYFNKAVVLDDLGRKSEAIECYDAAIRIKPDDADAYNYKGVVLEDLGRKSEAIECYDAAIRIKPDYAVAFFNKGNALNNLGRKNEAIECYDAAIRIQPDIAIIYFKKGLVLDDLGRNSEAIECYDAVIRIKPDFAGAYNNKGNALNNLGRNSEAIEYFDAAIRIKPDFAMAYNNKGIVFGNLERISEAIECYDAAIKLNPSNHLYYCYRAAALIYFGREIDALQDLKRAYALMQKMQKISTNNALSKENAEFINAMLNQDRNQLLSKLANLQKNSIEFEEGLQQLKSAAGDNSQFKNQIDDKYITFQIEKYQIVWNVVCFIGSNKNNEDWMKKVLKSYKKIAAYEKKMQEVLDELRMQMQVQIRLNQIDHRALKINPEIENNPKLKLYFSALYDRLDSAVWEAEVICWGNIATITSNAKVVALSKAIELIPFVGSLLSSTFSEVAEKISEDNEMLYAIKLKSATGSTHIERENVIKRASETITLNSRDKLDNIETNLEVEHWIYKGFISKFRDFFAVGLDRGLYLSKPQMLGCIDALKIIYAIKNGQIKQNPNSDLMVLQIATVPSSIVENKKKSSMCKIFMINEIEYRNHLLNKPGLLTKISEITGFPIYKIIDYSNMLTEMGYDVEKLDIDTLCCLIISLA